MSLLKKQYCIFNKQYTKEGYFELVEKIKKHMDDVPYIDKGGRKYGFGEFSLRNYRLLPIMKPRHLKKTLFERRSHFSGVQMERAGEKILYFYDKITRFTRQH